MKKLFLFFLLLLIASCSEKTNWVGIGGIDRFNFYANFSSIEKSGNISRLENMLSYKEQQSVKGVKYFSMTETREYNCLENTTIRRSFILYSKKMAAGDIVYTENEPGDEWTPTDENAVSGVFWKIACGIYSREKFR